MKPREEHHKLLGRTLGQDAADEAINVYYGLVVDFVRETLAGDLSKKIVITSVGDHPIDFANEILRLKKALLAPNWPLFMDSSMLAVGWPVAGQGRRSRGLWRLLRKKSCSYRAFAPSQLAAIP